MILPVWRSGVRWLHDVSSVKGSPLAFVPYILPLDKNIVFHKACAKYFIFVCVFGHASAHYFNYAAAPYYNGALGDAIYLLAHRHGMGTGGAGRRRLGPRDARAGLHG